MATTNVTVTGSWAKVVDAANSFLLTASSGTADPVEVATFVTASDTVVGHRLNALFGEGITRDLIGPGDVYVRVRSKDGAVVILNSWTPT